MAAAPVDVLVVGAGPTGLALALQLSRYGVRPRVVDRATDRVHESRALAIQPRTLEVLAAGGVADELVAAGNPAVGLRLHVPGREVRLPLFDLGLDDTAYPYLLFLSQAETERILAEHLAGAGVPVERGVELVGLTTTGEDATAVLRRPDGSSEQVTARYVVGCDGAHSAVRRLAGIGFAGAAYPQSFVLADVGADGIEPGNAHAYLSRRGMLFFFPLVRPAAWRLLVMRPPGEVPAPDTPLGLDEVQRLVDGYTGATVRLHGPVWLTDFRLHHRAATAYRRGPVFLAGDAAHIHSPAGAQGMNTGIQDAVNLAWKLAQALRGGADPALLDSYQYERAPIGRMVLRFTDRAFTAATSTNPLVAAVRTRVVPVVAPLAARLRAGRAYAFRTVSQLAIRYRRSPLSVDGPGVRRFGPGPRAGDRLPDGPAVSNGRETTLHRLTAGIGWHLLLSGPEDAWPPGWVERVGRLAADRCLPLTVHRVDVPAGAGDRSALRRLRLDGRAVGQVLVRPDSHLGYHAAGTDLAGLAGYLDRWLPTTVRSGGQTWGAG